MTVKWTNTARPGRGERRNLDSTFWRELAISKDTSNFQGLWDSVSDDASVRARDPDYAFGFSAAL